MQIYQCPNCGRTYTEFENIYYCINCNYKLKKQENITKIKNPQEREYKIIGTVSNTTKNVPKCPTCQSTNIKKITLTSKAVNTTIFGIFGTKRHKTFHCNNCGYEW